MKIKRVKGKDFEGDLISIVETNLHSRGYTRMATPSRGFNLFLRSLTISRVVGEV